MVHFSLSQQVNAAVEVITGRIERPPTVGLILGSGLGYLLDEMTESVTIPYSVIPGFLAPSVDGHEGVLVVGSFGNTRLVALKGQSHFYEGHEMAAITFPVQVLAGLGVETLIITNAAGGLNADYNPGDLMIIKDHINFPGLIGANPLIGLSDVAPGQRFLNLTNAYDPGLIGLAMGATVQGATLRNGVYVMVSGPNYETPAEQRFLRMIGADAVGMSTVPEVLVARYRGLKILAISCIANVATDAGLGPSHEEVLAGVNAAKPAFAALLRHVLAGVS